QRARCNPPPLIPAQAGIQSTVLSRIWVPAFAGTSGMEYAARSMLHSRATPAGHRQRHALLFAELLVRMVVRMRIWWSRRRDAGIGDRLILRQPLPAHLGAARRGRRRVDGVAAGLEHRAVKRLGRMLADIAAAHVAREAFEVAL